MSNAAAKMKVLFLSQSPSKVPMALWNNSRGPGYTLNGLSLIHI